MVFHLSRNIAEQIIIEANHAVPEEACGVLVGRDSVITNAISIRNIATAPERAYVLEPAALVKAINSAESSRQDVIGFYHSHPQHAARPSSTDIREWNYPDLLMVIASVAENKIAAWQVQGVEITPVELVLGETAITPEIPLSNAGKTAIIVSVILAILAVLVISLTLLPPAPPIP